MTISSAQLQKIASLARLTINDTVLPAYTEQINNVLTMIEEMDKTNTDGIEPLSHPLDLMQRLRSDEVSEFDQREAYQAIAPKTSVGLYLVPKVIE